MHSLPTPQWLNIHAHTCLNYAINNIWNRSKEICQCKNSPECAGYPLLLEHAGVQTIPVPALFICSLFTEVMISHRKYNNLLHNFQPSFFCSSSSYPCPLVGMGLQMFPCRLPSVLSLCWVLRVALFLKAGVERSSVPKSSTPFEASFA